MIYIQTYICYGCPGYLATSVSDPFNFDGSLDPHLGIVDPDPIFGNRGSGSRSSNPSLEIVDPDPDFGVDPGTYFSIIIFFLP